ncbi:cysteine desulfurase family protein [Candidatus Laterigemmans baculatus]|uniref:cysteine desulfurase family protein n=1 Tax=Candidatus Laterigemmans baculatus TaxID=2770505 RepID=UPI0013D951A1|nr:cysteine desulfurase family protein [Candidatus Laterigemmans baculatus]
MHYVYLDFNSTSPLAPSVHEAMEPFWAEHFMLPGQNHAGCQGVAEALERAREGVAELVGCEAFEIVFTSGGTEANNLAVLGVTNRSASGHVIVSALEHESVCNAVGSLERRGWRVDVARAGSDGVVEATEIERLLRDDTRLVCLQAANPILGTIQPVREVADICHARQIPIHCDAVQLFGKLPVDVGLLRADTVSVSGHKFYGPKGAGALFVRRGFSLSPVMYGEIREMGLRPGSENVTGWIGLGAASRLAGRCAAEAAERMSELRARFVQRLCEQISPQPTILCEAAERLPNTATIELPGDAARIARVARHLVLATPRTAKPADEMTRCLQAIGLSPQRIGRCFRISLGWTTSQEQIDRAADLLAEAWDTCRA